MFEELSLTLNAQFFRPLAPLTDDAIEKILDAASLNADGALISSKFRDRLNLRPTRRNKYSLRVFRTKRPVHFLANEQFQDTVHAYVLLLEIDGYVVISRKACGAISEALDGVLEPVGADTLTSVINDADAEFQQLSVRNMTVAETAIRSRSFEAVNLRGLISTHGAGRSVPYYMRIREAGAINSYALGTSRMAESSARQSAHSFALWARKKIQRMATASAQKGFLSSFARTVDLSSVLKKAKPSALLVDVHAIRDRLSSGEITLHLKRANGELAELPGRVTSGLLDALSLVHEIKSLRILGIDAEIKVNKRSLSISAKSLRRIRVEDDGRESTLQAYIIRNNLFSVCFSNPKFMYFMGQCFEDAAGIAEIDQLLTILVPQPSFGAVNDEKGPVTAASTSFDPASLFSVVETLLASEDFIFCDDLGDEWADHISLRQSDASISFVHSKHGSESKSAANMHEVVGQAVKNLGNMFFSADAFEAKYRTAFRNKRYKKNKIVSQINRLRKGNPTTLDATLEAMLANYKLHRKCIIACTFLSKNAVAAEFHKMKAGKKVKGNIPQLFWIISSFAHAARDLSVVPIIFCKP